MRAQFFSYFHLARETKKKKKYKICSLDVQLKATLLALLIKRMFERESFFSFLLSLSLSLVFLFESENERQRFYESLHFSSERKLVSDPI